MNIVPRQIVSVHEYSVFMGRTLKRLARNISVSGPRSRTATYLIAGALPVVRTVSIRVGPLEAGTRASVVVAIARRGRGRARGPRRPGEAVKGVTRWHLRVQGGAARVQLVLLCLVVGFVSIVLFSVSPYLKANTSASRHRITGNPISTTRIIRRV